MESWRLTWRLGFAPLYTDTELLRLHKALRTDDFRLTQGSTTTPPPLLVTEDWTLEACDPVTFPCAEWGETTVGQAEEYFARKCYEADQRLAEPGGCRWLLNWIDDTPRPEMLRELAEEVSRELLERTFRGNNAIDLDPDLQKALDAEPDSWVLKQAVSDWYREQGSEWQADLYARWAEFQKTGGA